MTNKEIDVEWVNEIPIPKGGNPYIAVDMHSLLHDIKELSLEVVSLKEELAQHKYHIKELEDDIDCLTEVTENRLYKLEDTLGL